jgi:GDPmannose 4,6-dehydratase
MNTSKVLIVGHKGQDGTLLRESLAAQHTEVVGLGRGGLDYYDERGDCTSSRVGETRVEEVILEELPSEIYYLAAEHTSSEGDISTTLSPLGFTRYTETNVGGFLKTLDAVRLHSPQTRVFYASSSHVFGPGEARSLSETSPFNPQSFYAITKAQAMWVSQKFRREAGLHVSCGILFNHESHLRNPSFFSAKIIQGAIQVQRGLRSDIFVGNLDARADWGYARDFVEAFQILVRRDLPDDYVIATGETHTVREFVSAVFEYLDLDWREFVQQDPSLIEKRQNIEKANPSKIFGETSWRPKLGFEDFVRVLVSDHLDQRRER